MLNWLFQKVIGNHVGIVDSPGLLRNSFCGAGILGLLKRWYFIGFVGVALRGYPDLMRFSNWVGTGAYPYIGLFQQPQAVRAPDLDALHPPDCSIINALFIKDN